MPLHDPTNLNGVTVSVAVLVPQQVEFRVTLNQFSISLRPYLKTEPEILSIT